MSCLSESILLWSDLLFSRRNLEHMFLIFSLPHMLFLSSSVNFSGFDISVFSAKNCLYVEISFSCQTVFRMLQSSKVTNQRDCRLFIIIVTNYSVSLLIILLVFA